jgi:hypothetical protein
MKAVSVLAAVCIALFNFFGDAKMVTFKASFMRKVAAVTTSAGLLFPGVAQRADAFGPVDMPITVTSYKVCLNERIRLLMPPVQ